MSSHLLASSSPGRPAFFDLIPSTDRATPSLPFRPRFSTATTTPSAQPPAQSAESPSPRDVIEGKMLYQRAVGGRRAYDAWIEATSADGKRWR